MSHFNVVHSIRQDLQVILYALDSVYPLNSKAVASGKESVHKINMALCTLTAFEDRKTSEDKAGVFSAVKLEGNPPGN